MSSQAIRRYRDGAGVPASAIAGLSREQLLAFPVPGTWSIQQIVMHLFDSDLVAADRMKRVIAEDNPSLLAYDENRWAARLHYHERDARKAAELFRLNREIMADLLEKLTPEDFRRTGVHSERGVETLLDVLTIYTDHLDHHMKFLHEKRRLLG
jgi:uncharacterized damage-inducible protein DinB